MYEHPCVDVGALTRIKDYNFLHVRGFCIQLMLIHSIRSADLSNSSSSTNWYLKNKTIGDSTVMLVQGPDGLEYNFQPLDKKTQKNVLFCSCGTHLNIFRMLTYTRIQPEQ